MVLDRTKAPLALIALTLACATGLGGSPAVAARADTQSAVTRDELIAAARKRADAFAAGRCKTLAALYPSDFRIVEADSKQTRATLLEECAVNAHVDGHHQQRLLSAFTYRSYPGFALLDYLYETDDRYGSVTTHHINHQVDTYVRRNGTWVVVLAVDSAVNRDPPMGVMNRAAIADTLGRYVWVGAPKMVDTVTRRGDRLFVTETGNGTDELLPLGHDTYFLHGLLDRITFERDRRGRIVREVDRAPDGEDVVAIKR